MDFVKACQRYLNDKNLMLSRATVAISLFDANSFETDMEGRSHNNNIILDCAP